MILFFKFTKYARPGTSLALFAGTLWNIYKLLPQNLLFCSLRKKWMYLFYIWDD